MNKQEHIWYLLGQMKATMNHITTTSYNDMPQALNQIASANGFFLKEMEEINQKPDSVIQSAVINIQGDVKIWTSES